METTFAEGYRENILQNVSTVSNVSTVTPRGECFHGTLFGLTVETLLTVETCSAEGHRGNILQNVSTVSNVATVNFMLPDELPQLIQG